MSIQIHLPFKANIQIIVRANAGDPQRVRVRALDPWDNELGVWEGNQGEIGRTGYYTGNHGGDPRGCRILVTIDHNVGNSGNWAENSYREENGGPEPWIIKSVLSDDAGDADFNDAVVYFHRLS